jgi:hypothetical protein
MAVPLSMHGLAAWRVYLGQPLWQPPAGSAARMATR